mmetsp:Transcript_61956/g.72457  ORF Transcript_61956/g.72457 Transcript_61956/m.72457 type:complete len:740 (+) Transcript_61956:80-2299(+)|eukprot:CAMPEP_0194431226 /NCGR_PEP_ID=MMETSP0176-20130528/61807_1 /TAXON_ID=216777 /ORGANISM="Proboscia alata, Strain PI-D3" /LENGTH=739 /DNA_ID=CAMNT_0039246257 /DNA_START=70 /DNA_END=2289 /DNA_ORIENTATION=+
MSKEKSNIKSEPQKNSALYYVGFRPEEIPVDLQYNCHYGQAAVTCACGFRECEQFQETYGLPEKVEMLLTNVLEIYGVRWVDVEIPDLKRPFGRWHLTLDTHGAPKFITNAVQCLETSPKLIMSVNKTVRGKMFTIYEPKREVTHNCDEINNIQTELDLQKSILEELRLETGDEVESLTRNLDAYKDKISLIKKQTIPFGKKLALLRESECKEENADFRDATKKNSELTTEMKRLQCLQKEISTKLNKLKKRSKQVEEKIAYLKKSLKEYSSAISVPRPVFRDPVEGFQNTVLSELYQEFQRRLSTRPKRVQEYLIPVAQQIMTMAYCHQLTDQESFVNEYFNFLELHTQVKSDDMGNGDFRAKVDSFGPDDKAYTDFPALQQYLPRGFTLLDKGVRIFGLHKFGGTNDEVLDGKMVYEDVDTNEVSVFLSTYKANGESMLWTFYLHPEIIGQIMIAVGSKNIRHKATLDGFLENGAGIFDASAENINVENMAGRMAYYLRKHMLSSMNETQRHWMVQFCIETGATMIAEFEDTESQHITLVRETRIVFIGMNNPHLLQYFKVPITHPLLTHLFGEIFGFHSVIPNLNFRKQTEYSATLREICTRDGDEGDVLLLFKKSGALEQVKVKSAWYILLRSLREILKRAKTIEEAYECIDKRITNFKLPSSKGFLPLTDGALDYWSESILKPFAHFVYSKDVDCKVMQSTYPLLFQEFQDIPENFDVISEWKNRCGCALLSTR